MLTRSRRYVIATATLIAAAAAAAPAAHAATVTFGSDLTAPANITESRPADTPYWQTTFANGASPVAPVDGQVKSVRLKGIAFADPKPGISGGETMWHFQAIRRLADGTYKVLRSSGAFYVPTTGDPQQITTYTPENFCVEQGDYVTFNTVGGWDTTANGPYFNGTPLQIFSRVPGAVVSEYFGPDKTNNGDILYPDTSKTTDHELLMQMTVGTAEDAIFYCNGGLYNPYKVAAGNAAAQPGAGPAPAPKAARKVTIPTQRVTVSRKGALTVALFCPPGAGPCTGSVKVMSAAAAKPKQLASKRYTIRSKSTAKIALKLSASALRTFKRSRGKLAVKIVSETAPGGAERITSAAITLRKRGG